MKMKPGLASKPSSTRWPFPGRKTRVIVCTHLRLPLQPHALQPQAPLSVGFPRQGDWSRHVSSSGHLPAQGTPVPSVASSRVADSLPLRHPRKPCIAGTSWQQCQWSLTFSPPGTNFMKEDNFSMDWGWGMVSG